MKLIIDFGNTLTKVALFEATDLVELKTFSQIDSDALLDYIKNCSKIKSVIVSSVIDYSVSVKTYLREKFYFIELNENIPIPIINKYKTPQTLGKDRLAGIVGANYLYPRKNILVIDAGTCTTYDFINAKNEYLGGSISPGITMRFKALHNFTDKLPLLEENKFNGLIGQNTNECIWSGVLNGVVAEMDGIIGRYQRQFEKIIVVLSGGNMIFFDKKLKNTIFAIPNIVLIGLNVILDFNEKH